MWGTPTATSVVEAVQEGRKRGILGRICMINAMRVVVGDVRGGVSELELTRNEKEFSTNLHLKQRGYLTDLREYHNSIPTVNHVAPLSQSLTKLCAVTSDDSTELKIFDIHKLVPCSSTESQNDQPSVPSQLQTIKPLQSPQNIQPDDNTHISNIIALLHSSESATYAFTSTGQLHELLEQTDFVSSRNLVSIPLVRKNVLWSSADLSYTPDLKVCLVTDLGVVQCWNVETEQNIYSIQDRDELLKKDRCDLTTVRWIPQQSSVIVVGDRNGNVKLIDTRESVKRRIGAAKCGVLLGKLNAKVTSMSTCVYGEQSVVASDCRGNVSQFDLRTKRCSGVYRGATASVTNVQHLSSGCVITSSLDGYVRMYETNKRSMISSVYIKRGVECMCVLDNNDSAIRTNHNPISTKKRTAPDS